MEDLCNSTKKRPTKLGDMTKDQIRQAIVKKKECNATAQKIVISLLEKCVSEEYFLQCLPHINQSHFEDILEERSIVQLCGYPVCPKTLSVTDIPKQKYRISTKTNKVYDITARKGFCSNSCYKAAMHVKKQMLTSPLWFREYEELPNFHLLSSDSIGSLGQEVDVALVNKISVNNEKEFKSVLEFTNAKLSEMNVKELEINENKDGTNREQSSQRSEQQIMSKSVCRSTNSEIELENQRQHEQSYEDKTLKNVIQHKKKSACPSLSVVGNIIEKHEKNNDPLLLQPPDKLESVVITNPLKSQSKKHVSVIAITVEVEKNLAEWFTIDTMLFLFGEEKVKEMVIDKGECIKEYFKNYAKSIYYTSNTYDQYQALCRKLNMLELEDKRFDTQTLHKETKPLPDYAILKHESKKIELKVRAFFSGETEIPNVDTDDYKKHSEIDVNNVQTRLPLVDKNAQNALRRKIIYQHLNKVLPDLLRSLGLSITSISSDVHLLINTFKLRADNIMFKPIQWTLIAIIVIKLLSFRDQRLANLLAQSTAHNHMQLLLLSYRQDGGYLDRLVLWLTDIDRLLNTNDKQLTVEK